MLHFKTILGKSEQYARNVICVFMTVIMGYLFLNSFLHTMELRKSEEAFEGIIYHNDNFIANAIYLAAILCAFVFVIPYLQKIPIAIQMSVLASATIILGVIWVMSSQSKPTEDSYTVSNAAGMAAVGDYTFMTDRYFSNNQYQLGFVFFCEILIRLFGKGQETLLYLQVINVMFLAAAYMGLLLILHHVFHSKRIQTIATVMLLFCLPPLLFTVFIYGIIPGITFSIYALLLEILFFQSVKKTRYLWAVLSILCIGIATMIKPNNYIVLIAMLLMALVKLIGYRKLTAIATTLIYIVVAAVFACNTSSAISRMYESRSGVTLDDNIPFISYMVMGLNYPNNVVGCTAAGWYNGHYTITNHENNGYDTEKSAKASMEQLKERLEYFRENPRNANDFFYEKNMSQWNEPTYASIWINIVRAKYQEVGAIANYICDQGALKATQYMNVYQMFVFLGCFAGVILCFRKKNIFCCSLILIVLGAFFYHMLFEGKSQYILPYFILLSGFSAVGTDYLAQKMQQILKNFWNRRIKKAK